MPQGSVYAFNPENSTWRVATTTGQSPSQRSVTATCTNDDTIFVYGGMGQRYMLDLFLLRWAEGGQLTWSKPQMSGFWPVRVRRAAVAAAGGSLFVFSGSCVAAKKGTTSVADIEEETWYRIKTGTDDTEELYPLVGRRL